MDDNRPEWVQHYIDIKSSLDTHLSEKTISQMVHSTPQLILAYKQRHPEVDAVILDNLRKQVSRLGTRALQCMYHKMKDSDTLIVKALEIAGIYVPKQELTNKYETMSKSEIIRDLKNQFSKLTKSVNLDKN